MDSEDIAPTATSDITEELGFFELDTKLGAIKTWKRVEYARNRIDELDLVHRGNVVDPIIRL